MIRDDRDDGGEKDHKGDDDDDKSAKDIYWRLSLGVSRSPGQPHMVHNYPLQTKFQNIKNCVPFLIVCLSAPLNNSTPRTWSSNLQELCQKAFLANLSLFFLASANDILWEDGWMFESFPELESAE